MTSTIPTDFSSSLGSSPSVQDDERRGIPIKKHIEASKGSLVLVETFPRVPTSLGPMQDVGDRALTIEEHNKASKSPLVKFEEILQSKQFVYYVVHKGPQGKIIFRFLVKFNGLYFLSANI